MGSDAPCRMRPTKKNHTRRLGSACRLRRLGSDKVSSSSACARMRGRVGGRDGASAWVAKVWRLLAGGHTRVGGRLTALTTRWSKGLVDVCPCERLRVCCRAFVCAFVLVCVGAWVRGCVAAWCRATASTVWWTKAASIPCTAGPSHPSSSSHAPVAPPFPLAARLAHPPTGTRPPRVLPPARRLCGTWLPAQRRCQCLDSLPACLTPWRVGGAVGGWLGVR